MKAADDFASKVGSGKGVDNDKIHKRKGKGTSLKKETSQIKNKSKGNPKRNTKGKEESPHSQTKQMERVQKNVVSPGKTGEKNTGKGGKKNTRKSGSKGKNNDGKSGGKAKKGQK